VLILIQLAEERAEEEEEEKGQAIRLKQRNQVFGDFS
jgi:hypothetical protein